ncbi:unnamed protein product [Tetraodon nigroviridis]|uniref:(spotted green pufferfish) hypothetical protein n=1 Tax=Tetraodon nigroviridis TaxID=99883 RepID=Q4S8P3_TETNG|nr:unnamed protein product [Tetraodon nigroviridis]
MTETDKQRRTAATSVQEEDKEKKDKPAETAHLLHHRNLDGAAPWQAVCLLQKEGLCLLSHGELNPGQMR